MKRILSHVIVPAPMPLLFFAIAFTPVHVLGCRARGLMALAVAFISGLAALRAAVVAARKRSQGDTDAMWWIVSASAMTVPVVALIIIA